MNSTIVINKDIVSCTLFVFLIRLDNHIKYTIMYPGALGVASEDIHCRCCLLQRARRALSEEEYYDKWDGEKRELVEIKAKTYNEFKEKTTQIIKKQTSAAACNDYGEPEKYLSNTHGVAIDDSVKELNFESVREGVQGIEKVLDEFPQARPMFKKIGTGNNGVMEAGFNCRIDFNPPKRE